MNLYNNIKNSLKENEKENIQYSKEDQKKLKEIYDSLQTGEQYGIDRTKERYSWITYPYFDAVLYLIANNGVGREVIGWSNYGSSANSNTLKDLKWILDVIFEMTPTEFLNTYIKRSDSKIDYSDDIEEGEKQKHTVNETDNLNEAGTGSNKYVNAYMALSEATFDGMGDADGWFSFAETLADEYGIKYNGADSVWDAIKIVKKGMAMMYEQNPNEFKSYVESLILDSCINDGYFDYLDSKSHKDKEIVKSLQILLEYLQNNGGSQEAIDGITNELNDLANVQVNARQVGEEFCRYMEENSFWKIMGTNCSYWTNKDLEGLPDDYACFAGDYFNFLLYDKWRKTGDRAAGLGYGFKNSNNGVIADLLTFEYTESKETSNVIYYDNFTSRGKSFEITPENKESTFAKMKSAFVATANKLKKEHLESYEDFIKSWEYEDTEEKRAYYEKNLRDMGIKESELKEMDNSNELTNIQFEEYCKDKLANLGTVEVENFDGDKIPVKVAFEQKIRDYGNCKVLDSEDTMNKLDSDGETIEFVDEKGEYHNSPMASPITILSRLEFDKIDNNYYKSVIQYWDDLKDLFESEESDGAKTYYNSLKRMIADLDRKIETANEQEGQRLIDQRAELMDKLTRLEDTYGNKLNEANTTSPYIDVSEIVKYAEVYLRDKLNCNCSIRKTDDGQYQLIIPNTHEIISSWLELHDSLMENEKLNEADATEEEIELLKTILADLKNEPLIKKYLYDSTWLSGSSTTVYPIMVSGPGKDIEIQLNTDKNVFKNLLKKYEDKYPINAYFWKSDGSCPSNLRFKLKESYNESERFVVNKTPYGFTEVSYKGYYISNMNGDTTVNINGDETLFNSVEEAIQTIDELDADPDYKYTDYSTDDEYNRIIQSHDVLRDNQKSKYNVFKTDDIEEVKKALSESADVDAIMSRYTAKNADYNYVVDKCLEAYNRGDLENAYDAWCRIHDILLEKLDKYEAEHKDDIKDEEKFALYKEFQEYIDRIPKDAMYEITDYGKNKIYKEEGYYESEELKEKEDTINGCELRYRGSNPYIDSYHVYLDGEIIGNLEKHERDVKNNYYVAWFPKDYKMIYSPNATWETKSYSTVEEAINALKDYYEKSKNMNESEKPHAIDSWTYLD